MKRFILSGSMVLTALAAFLISGAIAADEAQTKSDKASIVVGKVKSEASECSGGTADGIADLLAAALAKNEKFSLPSKGSIKSGNPKGNDLVVEGSVTKFEPKAGGSSGLGGLMKKSLNKMGVESKEATLQLKIRIVDVATGQKIDEQKIEASSMDWDSMTKTGTEVDGIPLDGSLKQYADQPMGKAIRTAVARMIETINKDVPAKYYRHADTTK